MMAATAQQQILLGIVGGVLLIDKLSGRGSSAGTVDDDDPLAVLASMATKSALGIGPIHQCMQLPTPPMQLPMHLSTAVVEEKKESQEAQEKRLKIDVEESQEAHLDAEESQEAQEEATVVQRKRSDIVDAHLQVGLIRLPQRIAHSHVATVDSEIIGGICLLSTHDWRHSAGGFTTEQQRGQP